MTIKCKLSTLMGMHRVKMTALSEAAGVSRSSIWRLYYNKAEKVDFQILDKLCKYFQCQPGDLLEYVEE